jgi:hypothetical protein
MKSQKVQSLRNKIQGTKCSCESINYRLERIDDDLGMVCCARCCDCHWDKMGYEE